ncbi:PrsW family intramembrane metalloprotease [Dictyobacter aurantiacus]|uniref:Protease PrsW n=1 Tax=Dictyobacter aurantiacus TaxID=1936993 RepID=A0A401ZFD6_9CHLR|nr:PrsW family intramembrane metalloprotease [Dictyobacter aurantiacus]GCE05572.1 hypothetical protein KDAU_29010 [Dictyobacter aurantiacus]
MARQDWTPSVSPLRQVGAHRGHSWLSALIIGLALFAASTIILFITGNSNLYPTVILIGNFLIPVVFVAFLYDHQNISQLTPEMVAKSFCLGGILGTLGAATFESFLIRPPGPNHGLTIGSAMMVGLIEEGCKIVAVMFMARHMRHDSALDGLLLGGSVGMGFAALESTGYAFTAFLASQGHISASVIETIARGILAPFGHGVWTAILGSVLFHESLPHRFRLTWRVILAYLFVSFLHGSWDGLPATLSPIYLILPPGIPISAITIAISVVGITILVKLYHLNLHQQATPDASRA